MIKMLAPGFYKKYFEKLATPFLICSIIMFIWSGYEIFFVSPNDYQQGVMVKVMYIHVPAAWLALGLYFTIGILSFISIIWRIKMAYVTSIAIAPIGGAFALITLISGALWGKPIWGTFWVWDARLTSMFVLFLLYLAYIAVINASDDLSRAEKPASVIALLGFVNVPIVKFSVDFWNSLHQPASVIRMGAPSIDASMLKPLMIMFFAYVFFASSMIIFRMKTVLVSMKVK